MSLLGSLANGDMLAAMDSSGVDIITATVTSLLSTNPTLPFNVNAGNCQPPVSYTNQFVDFGLGAITANQLLVSSAAADNGATTAHVVVLPASTNKVLVARPGASGGALTLFWSGAAEAMRGGMNAARCKMCGGASRHTTLDLIYT